MTTMPRFILASGSPRRRKLIASLGIDFEVIKPDIDEEQRTGESNLAYVTRLCQEKAQAVLNRLEAGTTAAVLAADTIVVLAADTIGVLPGDRPVGIPTTDLTRIQLSGQLLGKPRDAADARAMLHRLRNRAHTVCTAFTLQNTAPVRITHYVTTAVHMRDYTDAEIEAYIATGDPFDKAGSYAIQHPGFAPVARIEGCYNNVIGLPLCEVKRALAAIGWPAITTPEGCDCPPFEPRRL
ncbi:MAG: Maf family protein [bacterium]|nr:Maf family protein [bacterium]